MKELISAFQAEVQSAIDGFDAAMNQGANLGVWMVAYKCDTVLASIERAEQILVEIEARLEQAPEERRSAAEALTRQLEPWEMQVKTLKRWTPLLKAMARKNVSESRTGFSGGSSIQLYMIDGDEPLLYVDEANGTRGVFDYNKEDGVFQRMDEGDYLGLLDRAVSREDVETFQELFRMGDPMFEGGLDLDQLTVQPDVTILEGVLRQSPDLTEDMDILRSVPQLNLAPEISGAGPSVGR